MNSETASSPADKDEGSLFLGLIVCWLLNMVHLGVAYLFFVSGERTLSAVFVLVGAIGLLQIGYVAPIWYVMRRRGRRRMATGLAVAAGITLLFNASFWLVLYVNGS
jgi:hypothetical protein